MQYHWLHRNGSDRLVLFFCGWGSDYRPFERIASGNCDVACFYAYHTGDIPDWHGLLAPYRERHVVSWSMGVLQAEIALQGIRGSITSALAVNGTLLPVHDRFGIPCAAYQQTIDQFSEPALRKFIQKMCRERSVIQAYNEHIPQREIREQQEELIYHQQQSQAHGREQTGLFSRAIIGSSDMIFPFENMRNFWAGKTLVEETEHQHFPFYHYTSWGALIGQYTETGR